MRILTFFGRGYKRLYILRRWYGHLLLATSFIPTIVRNAETPVVDSIVVT